MTTPFEGSKTVWVLTQKGTGSVAFVMVPKILDGRDKFESELNEAVAWRTLNFRMAVVDVIGEPVVNDGPQKTYFNTRHRPPKGHYIGSNDVCGVIT